MSFSTAYELLFKAVLVKHEALHISLKNISNRPQTFINVKQLSQILRVYEFVKSTLVKADTNLYLKSQLLNHNITHLYDFSSGTIGDSLGNLKQLEFKNVITSDERNLLNQSSMTLIDIRRNIDAHTFYGLTVSKDMNGDLTEVYLPAINLLIDIYHR